MRYKKGDLILDWNFISGNKYIWKILKEDEKKDRYNAQIICRTIKNKRLALPMEFKSNPFFNKNCKKISKENAFLENL